MSRLPRASMLALAAAVILPLATPVRADGPYEGWRGLRSSRSTPSYVGYSSRRPLDDSPRYATPPAIWTGLYVGGHLGGAWGDVTPNGLSSASIGTSGLTGGLHAGYNFQFDRIVAGFEVDTDWGNTSGSAGFPGGRSVAAELNWLSSARLRLGYSFDNVMIYGTGGFAFADTSLRTTALGITSTTSEINAGYVIGAGVEMKLTRNLSGRIEALHYGFGSDRYGTSAGVLSVDQDYTTVRAGLSLHLN